MKIQDLMNAWDEAVERATSDTARESELSEERLNTVAGMMVQSGIKGGGWSAGNTEMASPCGLTMAC